jgi:hypothetical protein
MSDNFWATFAVVSGVRQFVRHCLPGSDTLYYGRNLPLTAGVMLPLSLQKKTNHARRRMKGENIPEVTCRWSENEESSRESIRSPAKGRCASVEQGGDQVVTSVLDGYFRWHNGYSSGRIIDESEFDSQKKQRFLSCLSKNIEFCPGTELASLLIDAPCSCFQSLGRETDAHLRQA